MANKKLRTVLVGCGGIANAWLGTETAKKQIEIVGLVDVVKKAAEAKAEAHGFSGAAIGTDLQTVLKQTDPEVVFDCTVPEAHCAVTLTALRHGCHVLGEKPMADTMANARRMVAAAEKANKTYAVIQNRRYLPQIRSLRRFLDSGAIGRVTTVNSDFYIGAHFGGFRDEMQHVLLLDMAIHSFDQARLITGADAEAVYCHEFNPSGSWYKHGASATAVFEMSDGLAYTYNGSWCAEGCNTSWECSWRIIGEKGAVLWNGGDDFKCEVVTSKEGFMRPKKERKIPIRCPKRLTGGHNGVLRDFVTSLREGGTPETICTDNIKSLAMVHAAVQSADRGRRVVVA